MFHEFLGSVVGLESNLFSYLKYILCRWKCEHLYNGAKKATQYYNVLCHYKSESKRQFTMVCFVGLETK